MEKKLQTRRLVVSYDRTLLRRDLMAGLTVAAVAVPQAMAYALIAGVPPEYGLYTAIIVTAIGSLFGSSSHLINGPTNAISLVVFSAVAGLTFAENDPSPLEAVFLLAALAGLIQCVIALLKLGDLTRYVSESVILGFMTGAGLLVALGQVHNLLGLRQIGDGHVHFIVRFMLTLTQGGPVNLAATAVGLGTVLIVAGLHRANRKWNIELPEMLIGLLLSSVLVWLFQSAERGARSAELAGSFALAPVATIGSIPRTLPHFHLPEVRADWIQRLSGSALAIALLGLLEALAIAKSIAVRTRETLDFNQQCLAEGLSNLGGGLLQCMPGSGSLTRSAINFHAGAATRFSGIVAALAVAATVLLFAPLARYVPKPALAGILFVTAWRLVDRQRLRYCLRATRFDAGVALATAGAAIFVNIEFSILIGVFLSFLFFVPRVAKLDVTELVVSEDRVIRERLPDDPRCSRMVLVSLEGELFFGAAPELDEYLQSLLERVDQGARVVVLRLKRARNPDMVCLEHLQHFLLEMKKRNASVLFCGVREDFARALRNVHMDYLLPADHLFLEEPTIGSATLAAVRKAYEILGDDLCSTCPRRRDNGEGPTLYYMI